MVSVTNPTSAAARYRTKRATDTGDRRMTFWLSPAAQAALARLKVGSSGDAVVCGLLVEAGR